MSAADYGKYFWHIETHKTGVMANADRAAVEHGCLMLFRDGDKEKGRPEQLLLAYAPGQWLSFGAASVMDGHRIAVDSVNPKK
jgi:hypothetical protein